MQGQMEDKNLVLYYVIGGPIIIGRKFGTLIKSPRVINIEGTKEAGSVSFRIQPMLFNPKEVHVDALVGFWHIVDHPELINAYAQTCGEIIRPTNNLVMHNGGMN